MENQVRKEAGALLKALREQAGLSQRELARLTGTSHGPFITQIEQGTARVPADRYEIWAKALQVHPRDLALKLLRFYDRALYDVLFSEFEPRQSWISKADVSKETDRANNKLDKA